jgi:hypothetical protein
LPQLKGLDKVGAVFPPGYDLLPQVNEVYELRLAAMESSLLAEDDAIRRAAYFGSIHGRATCHFCLCSGEPLGISPESARRRAFFTANIFKTGYATHGFFPYRGKFHPQMVKGLLNVMGLAPGDLVLDPMMGSGTTVVEAATMGIRSAGIDANPFCVLMARAKADALVATTAGLYRLLEDRGALTQVSEALDGGTRWDHRSNSPTLPALGTSADSVVALAHLDALGFSMRSQRLTRTAAFAEILVKYAGAMDKFQRAARRLGLDVAPAKCLRGDARDTGLPAEVVDGIMFSPPYSFAVDYVANDLAQLKTLGVSPADLRSAMVGLRGKAGAEQLDLYRSDTRSVMAECHRLLKPGRLCTVVVGTNSRQLQALAKKAGLKNVESSLEEMWVDAATMAGLTFEYHVERQIFGIANSMREEAILFFRKPLAQRSGR